MAFTPFEHWVDVDLTATVPSVQLKNGFFTQDNLGALLGVKVYINHEPHNLNGSLVYYVKFSDGTTFEDSINTVSGNTAYVELPEEAYAVVGPVTVTLANRYENKQKALAIFSGYIFETTTSAQVTPGQSVPDLAAIQAIYHDMLEGVEDMHTMLTNGPVLYNVAQSLTTAQKVQAKTNIGAIDLTDDSSHNGIIFTVR